jgi:DnaK suppressor protein
MAIQLKRREERLKRMLLEKKIDLEVNLQQELKRKRKEEQDLFTSSVRDEGDLSHFGFEQEIGRRQMIICNEKLRRITHALDRLNQASYGICEECGAKISEKRLKVVPFTAYCLECQEALEDQEVSEKIRAWMEEEDQPPGI